MGNGSKGLRVIKNFCLSSQPGTLRKKIICTKKVYEIDHAEICLRISSVFFLINFNDGVLPTPPPFKRWGRFILESSNHSGEELFLSYGRASPYGEHSDNGRQRRGGGYNSGQNNYHVMT